MFNFDFIVLIFCVEFIFGSIISYYINAYIIKSRALHIITYCMLIVSIAIAPYTSQEIKNYIDSPQTIEAITQKNSTTLDDWISYRTIIGSDGEIIGHHYSENH